MSQNKFQALVLREEDKKTNASIETLTLDALPDEDTLVKVDYSTLNYKDALAVTGKGKIVRTWPMVPGVDFAGTVVESSNPQYQPGTRVVLTGWSVGEKYWGGYSQYQRVKSEWLVPLPEGLTTRQAMMIGTAGFTAMLCVNALEAANITLQSGPVLVTGAAGGVGSVAVAILTNLGYSVTALTGDPDKHTYVKHLGATAFADGLEWSEAPRALEAQRWAAAIDTVGSKVLARVLAEMHYGGVVAACGLAGGADLPTTVMPFILRSVKLIGVDSVMLPTKDRVSAWQRIVNDLPLEVLNGITAATVPLTEVKSAAEDMLGGKLKGRVLVDVNAV
ncbi:MDR family oxidoreductase [Glaciimonas sp. Gout2]|uniref:MDR family oxidoreductase n=1 Tax=unclassified Glaciimonas TaxID=2644401 RepID=UPI002B22D920|nr:MULTISPECIES: MDR family oxidoreductase [unclassified Glaciimonas]MEB0010124.1 MDR family oxidoreductase [Glaciimonas sp. Cout2]MEB0081761.1 MDR family oxidoreductase [Glaciimonas sp. Gout2]